LGNDHADAVFESCGLRVLRSPPQAPRANATCKRVIGTLRSDLLDHILIVNKTHLHAVLAEYVAHYNAARPTPGHRPALPRTRPRPFARRCDRPIRGARPLKTFPGHLRHPIRTATC
jgi:hypothetical protein